MQNSQINLSHDMTPFDVNSKIVASKKTIPDQNFYGDPINKFNDQIKFKGNKKVNSVLLHQGYKTNPENFRRSPIRISRAKPMSGLPQTQKELKQQAHEQFDNDKTFVAYNSDMFRYHTNKV